MLELLGADCLTTAGVQRFEAGIAAYLQTIASSRGKGQPELVAQVEAEVKADPVGKIRFDAFHRATIYAQGRAFQGGVFSTPAICELRSLALGAKSDAPSSVRLFVLDGQSPATDIGALQAFAPPRTLFQVASQFNCLESPGRYVTDVADYFHDPTQGPRASISAFPGVFVRQYAAPAEKNGRRFVQSTEGLQINLLESLCSSELAQVKSGYLRAEDIQDPVQFAGVLQDRFEEIRVGVHDEIEVVLGHAWNGAVPSSPHRTIAQVCTSTIAGGMYGGIPAESRPFLRICESLQRAAYLGTLLAAAALGKDRVVLTLIGGGVFGNPLSLIWEAILWAVDQVIPYLHRDLVVVVNGRNLGQEVAAEELAVASRARGGTLLRLA